MSNFKTLEAWKVSMELVQAIYSVCKVFPNEEIFGLTSQLKRASVSIPANIAEGLGRKHRKDSTQFLAIARGSGYEVETLLEVAKMNNWLSQHEEQALTDLVSKSLRLINGLIKRFEESDLR